MNGLLEITRVTLPSSCVEEFYKHLRAFGKKHLEGVALLAGKRDGNSFNVSMTIVPAQKSYSLESGLLYSVDGGELFRINKYLYGKGLTLISQVHSHPTEAYHSETDDAFPIVTVLGGLSIVIPDFAFGPISMETWAVYRLLPKTGWTELNQNEVSDLITIIS